MKAVYIRVLTAIFGVPALAAGTALVLRENWSDRLPDVVATHWGPGGVDGSASLTGLTVGSLLASAALTTLAALAAILLLRRGSGLQRWLVGFHGWLATVPTAGMLASMIASLDAESWRQADGAGPVLVVLLGVSVAAGGLAALVAGPSVPPATRQGRQGPAEHTVDLASGQRAVWIGGTTNGGLAAVCVVTPLLVVVLVDLVRGTGPTFAAYGTVLLVGSVVALLTARLRVVVDGTGVTIRLGVFGLPRKRIALADIASATTDTLRLWSMGGVGIRLNPANGDVAYKVRGGPVLILTLRTGTRVLVTVDRPEQAAGLVNDLVRKTERAAG